MKIKFLFKTLLFGILTILVVSCNQHLMNSTKTKTKTAKQILGDSNYQAICYGGYRKSNRDIQPTIAQIREDMMILSAMNIKFIRTYNVHYDEVKNLLQVITDMKKENPNFEMYVMLGAWIDCKNAWTGQTPIHNEESSRNEVEMAEAVRLANQYPDIIKVISVGNEAMVKWATNYFVTPDIILKWVNYLQNLKKENKLNPDIWITSSDNFASWGGGDNSYHIPDLEKLFKAVDYISMHTYPMHDTHYNPVFWGVMPHESSLKIQEQIDSLMLRARDYSKNQYRSVKNYMKSLGIDKPIHIGETGWASMSRDLYGDNGSKACDEYKSSIFYKMMREWTNEEKIACFYFEAFDENWKDQGNPFGSENHFGLFTIDGKAKYMLWNEVDKGSFKNLKRDGNIITKSYEGNLNSLLEEVKIPKFKN